MITKLTRRPIIAIIEIAHKNLIGNRSSDPAVALGWGKPCCNNTLPDLKIKNH